MYRKEVQGFRVFLSQLAEQFRRGFDEAKFSKED